MALDRAFRLPRLWSNAVLREIAPAFSGEIINVSGWKDRDKEGSRYRSYFTRASAYYVSNYSGRKGTGDDEAVTDFFIDLERDLPDDLRGRFDVVFNHTTLEHVFEVRQAFKNLCAMSRDVVIVVVPFAQETHGPGYGDFWRLTPMGVRRLYQENGFEVIFEAASPHENAGIYLLLAGSRDAARWQGTLPDWQPLDKVGAWIGSTKRRAFQKRLVRLKQTLSGFL